MKQYIQLANKPRIHGAEGWGGQGGPLSIQRSAVSSLRRSSADIMQLSASVELLRPASIFCVVAFLH